MLINLRERLQALWVQSNRNRILITVGTCAFVILLLCGCLNLMGSIFGGAVNSLLASGPPVRPTFTVSTQQVGNINPTFPVPKPTAYTYPQPPVQNAPSSNTPAPTPTPSPTPTPPPGGGGGNGPVTFTLGPDPSGQAFQAGVQNTITLSGPPGKLLSVSVYAVPACLSMATALDASGNATLTCDIPPNLKGSQTNMSIQGTGGIYEQFNNIPIN
jgi:hypothetical protein